MLNQSRTTTATFDAAVDAPSSCSFFSSSSCRPTSGRSSFKRFIQQGDPAEQNGAVLPFTFIGGWFVCSVVLVFFVFVNLSSWSSFKMKNQNSKITLAHSSMLQVLSWRRERSVTFRHHTQAAYVVCVRWVCYVPVTTVGDIQYPGLYLRAYMPPRLRSFNRAHRFIAGIYWISRISHL